TLEETDPELREPLEGSAVDDVHHRQLELEGHAHLPLMTVGQMPYDPEGRAGRVGGMDHGGEPRLDQPGPEWIEDDAAQRLAARRRDRREHDGGGTLADGPLELGPGPFEIGEREDGGPTEADRVRLREVADPGVVGVG